MQENVDFEREALHLLPELLPELFDDAGVKVRLQKVGPGADRGIDATAEAFGRRWAFELKASSRPGVVAATAEQLAGRGDDELAVLVVPFMTPAGARVAEDLRLNWLDLSGNASIRGDDLYISVRGNRNKFVTRGRPSSPFAPKSSRVARAMLADPQRWWRQKELSAAADLDDGHVSRIVGRLSEEMLLEKDGPNLRPLNPSLLLAAWDDEYRFDRHDIILGHASGSGIELARDLHERLAEAGLEHAFTGLPAAWLLDPFARFRLNSVYVQGDPREAASQIGLRRDERGANVQVIGPDDLGVFMDTRNLEGLPVVSPVQVYLDLRHLPERAKEAADNLLDLGLWDATRQ